MLKKRTNTQQADPLDEIKKTILHLSDPHPTLSLKEDVDATANMILEEYSTYGSSIAECCANCLIECPQKLEFYIEMLIIISSKNVKIFEDILSIISSIFCSSQEAPWRHFTQPLCIFTSFAEYDLLEKKFVDDLLTKILQDSNTKISTLKSFVRWSVAISLKFFGSSCVSLDLESEDCDDTKVLLSPEFEMIKFPEMPTCAVKFTPERLDFPTDHNAFGWDSNFSCQNLSDWHAFYNFRIILESHELNHKACSESLLRSGTCEQLCNFLFGEMLRIDRSSSSADIYYEILLIDLCRLAPKDFPPILASFFTKIVKEIDSIVKVDRLSTWFAFHLSNFGFKWSWDKWECYLQDTNSLQYIFCKFSIEKSLNHSYYDRLLKTLPNSFQPLLIENSLSIDKNNFLEAESELTKNLFSLVDRNSQPALIFDALGVPLEDGNDISKISLDTNQMESLLNAFLIIGSRSFSHQMAIIEKYLSLFTLINRNSSSTFILDQLLTFFGKIDYSFEFIVERLINYRVISVRAVLEWLFDGVEDIASEDFNFSKVCSGPLSHRLLMRTLQQSSLFPLIAKAKLKKSGESSDKIDQVFLKLSTDFENILTFFIKKLALLSHHLDLNVRNTELIEKMCSDYILESSILYTKQFPVALDSFLSNQDLSSLPNSIGTLLNSIQ